MSFLKGAAAVAARKDLGETLRKGFAADDAGGGGGEVPPGGAGGAAEETPPGAGAPAEEPAPEGGDGGAAPPAAEPAVARKPGAKPAAAAPAAPAGDQPPAGWKPPTYAEYSALEKRIADSEKTNATAVREQVKSILESFAQEDPAIYRALYQEDPPEGMFPANGATAAPAAPAAPAPGAKPAAGGAAPPPAATGVDPAVLKRLERAEGFISEAQRREVRTQIYNQAAAAADKFPIFTHPKFGLIAERQFLAAISKNPRGDYGAMAKEISDGLEGARAADRAEYLKTKKEVAGRVPAGAGPSGGAPPGQPPDPKRKLGRGKGSTMEGLSEFLKQKRHEDEAE